MEQFISLLKITNKQGEVIRHLMFKSVAGKIGKNCENVVKLVDQANRVLNAGLEVSYARQNLPEKTIANFEEMEEDTLYLCPDDAENNQGA